MKLSVVIVNYNVKYFLEQCLYSVLASTKAIETEVFVVDNHSADGSVEYLAPKFPTVTFIANDDNPGFSTANNQAIELATGEYILLLNPDTVIGEDTLSNVCRFMDERPDAGGLGVKMIDGCGRFLPESKRGFPSPWNSFCKMFGLSKLFPYSSVFANYHVRYLSENNIHTVDVLAGAFMLLRKKVLDNIGYLDESFFMYGEDIDMSYRITLGGYKNYYFPEKIIHYKGESTKKDVRYVKIFYEAMLIFFRKHYPHYTRLYYYFVKVAVYVRGCLSAVDKVFLKKGEKKSNLNRNILVIGSNDMSDAIFNMYNTAEITIREFASFDPKKETLTVSAIEKALADDVVFCAGQVKYKDMISLMDACKNKCIHYHIYHPETKIMVAANEVLACS